MLVPIFRFLSIFPLPVLHGLGAALGWVIYAISPSYRRRMRENMQGAGFSQHLHTAVAEAGKSVLELPFIWCAPPERAWRVMPPWKTGNWWKKRCNTAAASSS